MTKNTNITSPPTSKRGWRLTGLTFWWLMLAATVTLSSYGNVKHAEMVTPDEYLSVGRFIAAALPLSLLLMVEGIALAERAGASGRARLVGMSVVSVLAVIVFAASYVGLLSVVAPTQLITGTVSPLNYGLAAVPDLLMAAATVYLMSMRASARTTVEEPAAFHTPSPAKQILGNYARRWVEHSEGKKPQVQPVMEVRGGSPNTAVEVVSPSVEPSVDTAVEVAVEVPEPPVEPFVEVAKPSPKTSPKSSVKARKPSPKPSVDETLIPFMDAAQDMVDTSVVARKTAAELAAVIREVENGKSNNAVKQSLGVSPSTTEAVRAAWTEWRREHRLVAVAV